MSAAIVVNSAHPRAFSRNPSVSFAQVLPWAKFGGGFGGRFRDGLLVPEPPPDNQFT